LANVRTCPGTRWLGSWGDRCVSRTRSIRLSTGARRREKEGEKKKEKKKRRRGRTKAALS